MLCFIRRLLCFTITSNIRLYYLFPRISLLVSCFTQNLWLYDRQPVKVFTLTFTCPLAQRWRIGPLHLLSTDSCLAQQCAPLSRTATPLWTSPFLLCAARLFLAGSLSLSLWGSCQGCNTVIVRLLTEDMSNKSPSPSSYLFTQPLHVSPSQ